MISTSRRSPISIFTHDGKRKELAKVYASLVNRLNGMAGIECLPTDGTFYVFPKVQGLIDAHFCVLTPLHFSVAAAEPALPLTVTHMPPGPARRPRSSGHHF